MPEEVFGGGSSRQYISPREARERKKKALQSYSHIPTIQERSKAEQQVAIEQANATLDEFISSFP